MSCRWASPVFQCVEVYGRPGMSESQTNDPSIVPANEVEVLPAAVTEDVLDQVVDKINALHRQATLELALAVGQIIVEDLYGGDREAWRSRGTKDTSFRK